MAFWNRADSVKIVVGLGNPRPEYRHTRHNVGAAAVSLFGQKERVAFKLHRSLKCLVAERRRAGLVVCLALPQTYMNLSGEAVAFLTRQKHAASRDVLIVYDDADLPLGSLRVRSAGSAGGHNGMTSVIEQLKTEEIPRLRIGIGRGPGKVDLTNHVLSGFEKDELSVAEAALERAAQAIRIWIFEGLDACMNLFNVRES